MRVLVLCGTLNTEGGTQVYVRNLIRALTVRGHNVIAVSGESETPTGLGSVERWISLRHAFSTSFHPTALWRCWTALRALRQTWVKERIDIALLNLSSPLALDAIQRALPTIHFVHGAGTYCPAGTRWLPRSKQACHIRSGLRCLAVNHREGCLVSAGGDPLSLKASWRRILDMPLQRHFLRTATLVAVNSEYLAREIKAFIGPSPRVVVLAPPLLESCAAERAPLLGRIFVAGRLVPMKGFADAVQVAARLPQTRLVIAGDGPQRAQLMESCHALGILPRVDFLGWVPRKMIDEEMQKAQVVLFTSYLPETFGLVGAEAAMNGRAVVAYDTGGVRSWLSPDTGILIQPGDLAGLTRAVAELVADPARAVRLGQAARDAAKAFALPAFAERFETMMACAVQLKHKSQSRKLPQQS